MKCLKFLFVFICLVGTFVLATEEPSYTLIKQEGVCSIRDYKTLLIIEAESASDSPNSLFGILAGYIFGGNHTKQKIAMTAPVLTTKQDKTSKMIFVMPKAIIQETAPKPNNKAVEMRQLSFGKVAVITFSGRVSTERVQHQLAKLQVWMKVNNVKSEKDNVYIAQYNPPWILGPFRRNEIWVPLKT